MSEKINVLVDPHFRKMDEIFSAADKARLYNGADVVWGQDDPTSLADGRAGVGDTLSVEPRKIVQSNITLLIHNYTASAHR